MAAMKSSPPSVPTVLYNKRKVVVEFVANELSSFSSPYIPAPLIRSPLSSPCAQKEEPAPSSLKSPVKEGILERPRRNLGFNGCMKKGEKEEQKEGLETLRRKLDVCAQEIRECEKKEMDWAGGAGSGYIKAGKLKKKFARLCGQLEAHQGRISVADKVSCHDWMSLYLEENDRDPAESNPELQDKLNRQLKEGRSKINK